MDIAVRGIDLGKAVCSLAGAEGIAEAASRTTMSFAPIKTEEQLDLQALQRAQQRLVQDRT